MRLGNLYKYLYFVLYNTYLRDSNIWTFRDSRRLILSRMPDPHVILPTPTPTCFGGRYWLTSAKHIWPDDLKKILPSAGLCGEL